MKNLKPYNEDSFSFHKKVISKKSKTKKDPEYKDRLEELNDDIQAQYIEFEKHFKDNTLPLLSSIGSK